MPRVNKPSKWKPVVVNPAYIQSTGGDSFISLQELTDYTVLPDGTIQEIQEITDEGDLPQKKAKNAKKLNNKKQALKGPLRINNTPASDDATESTATTEQPQKKKRKKKKKGKKNAQPEASVASLEKPSSPQQKKPPKKTKRVKMVSKDEPVIDLNLDMLAESKDLPEPPQAQKRKRQEDASEPEVPEPQKKKKKKKKKKKNPKKNKNQKEVEKEEEQEESFSPKDMSAWMNLYVPEEIMTALEEQNFVQPTPIQVECLPAAIRDRRDIVGAAHTGSGKTLAFAIPILNGIMRLKDAAENEMSFDEEDDEEIDEEELDDGEGEENDEELQEKSEEEESDDEEDEEASEVIDLPVVEMPSDEDDDDEEMDLPPDEEDDGSAELEGDQVGCVRTVNNVTFDWMEKEAEADDELASKPLYALILTPTRELAIQVRNHINAAAKYTGINCMAIVGGMSVQKQERLLRKGPEIVVATPGRLWELYSEMSNHLSKMAEIRFLVLDEADRMVEKGHFEELEKILGTVNSDAENEKRRQTFVFSATLTFTHKAPERLFMRKKKKKLKIQQLTAGKKLEVLMGQVGMRERPKVVDLTEKQQTAETLMEARINCSAQERDLYLYYLLQQYHQRTLVFCNSKDCIRRLISIFTLLKCCPLPLHADMQQRQRLKNLDRFRGNPRGLLLATDVAARGLDIPGVEQVVHYQVPRTTESYVHRSGRTARASKEGLSIMMVAPDDLQNYRKIIKSLNRDTDLPVFPVESDFVSALKPRVSMTWAIDSEEHKVSKQKRENNWFEKQAKEMDIDLDEELLNDLGDSFEQARIKEKMFSMRSHLDSLLQQPVVRSKQSGKYLTQMGKLNLPYMTGKKTDETVKIMKKKESDSSSSKKNEKRKRKRRAEDDE